MLYFIAESEEKTGLLRHSQGRASAANTPLAAVAESSITKIGTNARRPNFIPSPPSTGSSPAVHLLIALRTLPVRTADFDYPLHDRRKVGVLRREHRADANIDQ